MLLLEQEASSSGRSRKDGRDWADIKAFQKIRVFSGDSKEWEEFAQKLKSQVAAADVLVAKMLDDVESKIAEAELEADDYAELLMDTDFDADAVTQFSSKMHSC